MYHESLKDRNVLRRAKTERSKPAVENTDNQSQNTNSGPATDQRRSKYQNLHIPIVTSNSKGVTSHEEPPSPRKDNNLSSNVNTPLSVRYHQTYNMIGGQQKLASASSPPGKRVPINIPPLNLNKNAFQSANASKSENNEKSTTTGISPRLTPVATATGSDGNIWGFLDKKSIAEKGLSDPKKSYQKISPRSKFPSGPSVKSKRNPKSKSPRVSSSGVLYNSEENTLFDLTKDKIQTMFFQFFEIFISGENQVKEVFQLVNPFLSYDSLVPSTRFDPLINTINHLYDSDSKESFTPLRHSPSSRKKSHKANIFETFSLKYNHTLESPKRTTQADESLLGTEDLGLKVEARGRRLSFNDQLDHSRESSRKQTGRELGSGNSGSGHGGSGHGGSGHGGSAHGSGIVVSGGNTPRSVGNGGVLGLGGSDEKSLAKSEDVATKKLTPTRKAGKNFNDTFEGFSSPPAIEISETDNSGIPLCIHIKAAVKMPKDIQTVHSIILHFVQKRIIPKYNHKKFENSSLLYVIPYADLNETRRDSYIKYFTILKHLEAGDNPKQLKERQTL